MSAREEAGDGEAPAEGRANRPTALSLVAAGTVGLVAAIAGMIIVLSGPTAYVSQATLLIDQPRAVAASTSEGLVVKLSRLRVKYADLAEADLVVDAVADETGIRARDVRKETFAFAPAQTLTVVAGARSDEKEQAERLAAALADELSAYAEDEQEDLDIPEEQQVVLTLIDDANEGEKVTPSARRALSVGALAFVVGAVAVAVGLPLVRDARR